MQKFAYLTFSAFCTAVALSQVHSKEKSVTVRTNALDASINAGIPRRRQRNERRTTTAFRTSFPMDGKTRSS